MTTLPRRLPDLVRRVPSDRDILVAAGAAVVVVGVAGAVLGKTGLVLVGGVVGLVLALVAVVSPPVALVLVLLASFTRAAQREVLPAEVLLPATVVLLISVTVALVRGRLGRARVGIVEWLMPAYLLWNLLSAVIPHQYAAEVPVNGEPFDLWRWFLGACLVPFAVYQCARLARLRERGLRWLLGAVVATGACSTWLSIAQFHAPALVWPRYIVEAPNWPGRANGIFNQPVVNGMVLVLAIVVSLYLASRPGTGRVLRIALYVLAAAAVYAVYLTHTRAAVLGLVAAVVIGALLARGWRRGFVVIAVLGALGLASQASTLLSPDRSAGGFGSPNEAYDRLNVAATALHAIADHPLLGVGVGRFGMYNTYEHVAWSDAIDFGRGQMIIAHENDLGIGAEVGLPGLAMWLAIVVGIAVLLWRARRTLADDGIAGGSLALVGLIALAVMMVNGFTVDLRPLEFTTILPLMLAGVAVGVAQRRRRQDPAPPALDATVRDADDESTGGSTDGGTEGAGGDADEVRRAPVAAR